MRKRTRRLEISRETLRHLTDASLRQVEGGVASLTFSTSAQISCTANSPPLKNTGPENE